MRFSKICLFAVACAFAFVAFADARNVVITFGTRSPNPADNYLGDTYVDGAVVLDGEWYALVWSPDGNFGGITTEGKPARECDKVIELRACAKNGHCPYQVFQYDSGSEDAISYGYYAVYMLDTRNVEQTAPAPVGENGKPALMNAVNEKSLYKGGVATGGGATAIAPSEAPAWLESVIPGDAGQPKITMLDLGADKVTIRVEGMISGVKYNVRMGKDVNNLENYALQIPQMSDNPEFRINKDDANYFQVVREPLKK